MAFVFFFVAFTFIYAAGSADDLGWRIASSAPRLMWSCCVCAMAFFALYPESCDNNFSSFSLRAS